MRGGTSGELIKIYIFTDWIFNDLHLPVLSVYTEVGDITFESAYGHNC